MKKVAIVAPTGMLGSMVYQVLKNRFSLVLVYRSKGNLDLLFKKYGTTAKAKEIIFNIEKLYEDYQNGFLAKDISGNFNNLVETIGEVDAVINCLGITNRHANKNVGLTFFVNSAFPHMLSQVYKEKLIHITTDCVFSGIEGAPYNENSSKSPSDIYGLSKKLGEPWEKSLVLRTSIIGPEIHGFLSLLEWVKMQKGNVSGYKNHFWNGITTKEFAKICEKIISNRDLYPKNGLFHVFSSAVSKYEVVCKIKGKYNLDITVDAVDATVAIDRRLSTVKSLNRQLELSSFDEMLKEL